MTQDARKKNVSPPPLKNKRRGSLAQIHRGSAALNQVASFIFFAGLLNTFDTLTGPEDDLRDNVI